MDDFENSLNRIRIDLCSCRKIWTLTCVTNDREIQKAKLIFIFTVGPFIVLVQYQLDPFISSQ